jgi:hypothetical protein
MACRSKPGTAFVDLGPAVHVGSLTHDRLVAATNHHSLRYGSLTTFSPPDGGLVSRTIRFMVPCGSVISIDATSGGHSSLPLSLMISLCVRPSRRVIRTIAIAPRASVAHQVSRRTQPWIGLSAAVLVSRDMVRQRVLGQGTRAFRSSNSGIYDEAHLGILGAVAVAISAGRDCFRPFVLLHYAPLGSPFSAYAKGPMTPEIEADLRTAVASLRVKTFCQELLLLALRPAPTRPERGDP